MGWLSDLFSGGSSSSSSSSSSNDDGPSPAPTPTVIPTGTTLKTGTVLNNDDDPVVFTPNDDGGFTGQNQSTLPAAEPETFGEAFAANRAAGEDTFVYKGEVYTTDLAPEAPSVSYDAFGNAYDTPEAAAQADQVAEAQAAAAQNAITAASNAALDPRGDQIQSPTSNGAGIASLGEDDVMSQTVVGTAGQDYADSLPDFSYDFTADDGGYGSPLPGDNVVADLSGYGNLSQADFISEAGPTAVDIVRRASPKKYYDAFGNEFSTRDAAGESDRAAEAAAAAALARPQNPFVDDLLSALKGTDPVSQAGFDLAKSFAIGVPSNAAQMFGGLADFVESRPVSGSGNLITDLGYELYSRMNPEMTQEAILSADPSISEQRPTALGARTVESGLQSAADYLTERFFPEGRDQAVVTGTTPSELAIETVSGEGGGTGLAGTVAEEVGGGVIDILGNVNVPARIASAGLNIGEQLSGTEATTREALTQLVNSGALADNERYQKVLASQGGDVEKAITAITRANTYSTAPQTAGTGVLDAAVPKFAKGLLGTAKDVAVRSQIEGGQEVAESAIALSGLNNILNLPEDKALQPLKDASGNYVMGALTGAGTSIVASPVVNAIGSKMDSGNATPAPNVLDPSQSPTAGKPAQSSVPSSYDEAGISGASDTMRSEIAPDKLTVAEELMMNQLEDEGAIDLNQLRDLDLTLFEMQSVADSAITKKMDADANMLQFVAEQEAIDNNGAISAELVDEIQTKLSPELAAEVIETASNAPYVDASGQSRMDIFLNNQAPSSLPAAPTEGIAPKVDTTSVGEASVAKAPASGIETVVAKSPDDIIAEQRQKSLIADLAISGNLTNESAEQLASQLGVDVITALDLVEEAAESMTSGEIDAAAVAAAEKAGSEAYDNFKPTTTLGKTTGILSAKDEAAREAAFNKAYEDAQAASRKDLFVGTGSDNADNATTEVKLPVAEETAAVVTEEADGSADVELPADQTVAEQLPVDQDVFAADQVEQEAAATAAEQAAATDTSTDTTTDTKVLTEVGEFPEPEVEVEVEEEEDPDEDVTVELEEDDTFVEPITSTDENEETITECPEGYVMVEGPDGPMCQKSVTSSRQRAGASTRAYTGLAGNRGRTGPGQRRRSTTTTERVRPTVRSA